MKEKDLRKLTRKQLLELLLAQTERVHILEDKLKSAEEALSNRKLEESEAGNIADAALKLNNVFKAAQAAADQYLENVKSNSLSAEEKIKQIEEDARLRAEAMIADAEKKCAEREQASENKLKEINEHIEKLRTICRQFNSLFTDDPTFVDIGGDKNEK